MSYFCFLSSSDAHLNKVSGLLQTILENYPYWAQIFIAVAIALERYIFICHGVKADEYLKEFNRYVLFSITILLSFGIPSLYTLDFVKHVDSVSKPCSFPEPLSGVEKVCAVSGDISEKNSKQNSTKCNVAIVDLTIHELNPP